MASPDTAAKGPQQAAGQQPKPTAGKPGDDKQQSKKPVDLETAVASLGSLSEGGGDGGKAFREWYADHKDKVATTPGAEHEASHAGGTVGTGTVDEQKKKEPGSGTEAQQTTAATPELKAEQEKKRDDLTRRGAV